MNQEKKNKIAIIGHTKGIGKAIANLYKSKKYEVIGLSRSNGYDLVSEQEKIMDSEIQQDRLNVQKQIADDKLGVAIDRLRQNADLKLPERTGKSIKKKKEDKAEGKEGARGRTAGGRLTPQTLIYQLKTAL